MTHLPFIQQPCGDVLAETSHMSAEEFGVYQLLSFAFWQHGALPDDDVRLARIARVTPERWIEMRDTMSELFGIDWTPERLAQRRLDVETLHLKNKANGRKGAKKRWQPHSEANGVANGEAISPANDEANGNYNHNYKPPRHEEKAETYTHARESRVDRRFSDKKAAGAWLAAKGGFPGDPAFDRCVEKLVSGTATWGDVERAAA